MSRLLTSLSLLAALGLVAPELAEPAAEDTAAFQSVVRAQIDALRRDDGPAAYARAAPGIQAMFRSPDIFLAMVREAYPPLYRPSSVAFGQVAETPAGPIETVYLTAADGTNWIALYRFEKQADRSWRISGCLLLKDPEPTV